jgi:hypothetical protein
MAEEAGGPFESIESAREFMDLLQESVQEALREVEELLAEAANDAQPRRGQALLLVLHKLKQLSSYTHKNQRILNDLRTLRRLLFDERGTAAEGSESAIAAGSTWE